MLEHFRSVRAGRLPDRVAGYTSLCPAKISRVGTWSELAGHISQNCACPGRRCPFLKIQKDWMG